MQKSPHMNPCVPLLFIGILVFLLPVVSCSPTVEPASDDVTVAEAPFPSTFNFGCSTAPFYRDSVICARWLGPNNDYFVSPLSTAPKGKYFAWPKGLSIDVHTGRINASKSESGMQYIIGFVEDGKTDTCHMRVVVAGVQYKDNIYVLSSNDTLATPYFNANPAITSLCDSSDDNDYPGNSNGNGQPNINKCEFDDGDDDDNGNGSLDEPPPGQQANAKNVRVRTKSGVINLKKTLEDGAFGANPQNGDSSEVTIYYRLSDCSMKALKKINVKLVYYHKQSDIPASIVTDIMEKKANFENGRPITKHGNPRPPMIVVTRE